MRFPHPGGGFGFGAIVTDVMAGLAFIIGLVIVVGLIVVLVRFLLIATKAAEIYVAKNSGGAIAPPSTATPVVPANAASTTVVTEPIPAAPASPASPTSTKQVPRTRTPKLPPSV